MKKISLINQVAGPLFIDIANAFSNSGFATTLHTGIIEETYASLDVAINVRKSQSYIRRSPIFRIITWSLFFLQVFFKLLFEKKDIPLLLVSNPPFAPFLGLVFFKLFKRPYYVLVYDIYPDALIEFNYLSADSWFVKSWSNINRLLFKNAEKIFTISKGMEQKLKEYCKGDNIHIVHSWVAQDFIKPIEKEDNWFVQEHKLLDKVIILYSGNLGITHDIETIVEAAKELQNDKRIQFLIIGSGAKEEKIRELIQEYGLKNMKLLPFQPADVVPFSMTSGDISLVTLAKGAGNLSVPSKTYYMMAAGMGIIAIAEEHSEIADLVRTNRIGKVVSPNNPKGLANTVLELVNNKEKLGEYQENALKLSKLFTPQNAGKFVNHCLETT